ncbi:MAG: hypothetical protein JNJ42_17415 [Burkholderiaceae bacterium]|jgi:hypothetical protein|nr:hypothetical protein [Burkholderiaceae bacterium]
MNTAPTVLKPAPRQQTPAPKPITPCPPAGVLRPTRVPYQLELQFHRAP